MGEALGIPHWNEEAQRRFLEREGVENFRVVVDRAARSRRKVLAVLTFQRTGQFFGGVSVPAAGYRCVGVATEARGRGVFRMLFEDSLKELRASGVDVANLFASNPQIYRAFGFETAGVRILRAAPIAALGDARDLGKPTLRAELLGPDAVDRVRALYTTHARRRHGWLDRGEWYWYRALLRETHSGAPRVYGLYRGEALEGYVALVQRVAAENVLRVTEYVVESADAMQTLLALVYGQRSAFSSLEWYGGPSDPIALRIPTPCIRVGTEDVAYLGPLESLLPRLVAPERALATRGYPLGVSADLHLYLEDALFAESSGPVRVQIEGGRAHVTPGGRGTVRVTPRGLAALFGNHARADALAAAGLLSGGSDEERARIDAAFSGESVWVFDAF